MSELSTEAPTAALIIIGSEVLSGKVTDENTPFVTQELRKLGVKLARVVIIPDDIDTIAKEVREAAAQFTWVFTTGGLGPTHDDMTMDAIAQAFGTQLAQSEELVQALQTLRRGKSYENLLRLTWIPENATLYWGDGERIWPTVHVENVYIFPGVPSFLRHRFAAMRRLLMARPFTCHTVFCSHSESELVNTINQVVEANEAVEIGSYPQFGNEDHRVRITFDALDPSKADSAMEQFLALLPEDALVRVEKDKDRAMPYA